jgi:DNA primase
MVKVLFVSIIFSIFINASEYQKNCVNCHEESNIPDIVIYKRYLLKYSNDKRMKKAIIDYLKNPSKKTSIMPHQFIEKFGFKKAVKLPINQLESNVEEFLNRHSLKKRLYIK